MQKKKNYEIAKLLKCIESANKIIKKNRLTHARLSNRIANMTDVFHRGIHISDPKILYSRINKNLLYAKKKPFSKNVLKLLKPWDPPNFSSWKIDYSMTDTVSSYCLPKE